MLTNKPRPNRNGDEGFTLLEILVVIAILGLLVDLAALGVLRQLAGARNSVARQSIECIAGVPDIYKLDGGSYPLTTPGLAALNTRPSETPGWTGPYLKGNGQLLDASNHPYVYRNTSTRPGHDYDLCSRGANGTDDAVGLICN